MNLIDMRTVLFSYVISSAICAAVMASLWVQNRRRSPELVFWMADFIMQFAALLLIVLRGSLPDILSMVLSNALIIGGTLLLFIGLKRYTGKAGPQWYNFTYLTAFVFVHAYFVYIHPQSASAQYQCCAGAAGDLFTVRLALTAPGGASHTAKYEGGRHGFWHIRPGEPDSYFSRSGRGI
jgi:hypothetical protein